MPAGIDHCPRLSDAQGHQRHGKMLRGTATARTNSTGRRMAIVSARASDGAGAYAYMAYMHSCLCVPAPQLLVIRRYPLDAPHPPPPPISSLLGSAECQTLCNQNICVPESETGSISLGFVLQLRVFDSFCAAGGWEITSATVVF